MTVEHATQAVSDSPESHAEETSVSNSHPKPNSTLANEANGGTPEGGELKGGNEDTSLNRSNTEEPSTDDGNKAGKSAISFAVRDNMGSPLKADHGEQANPDEVLHDTVELPAVEGEAVEFGGGQHEEIAENAGSGPSQAELGEPEVLPSLPPLKKATFKGFPSRRVKDEELKASVVMPLYLSKGMLVAIRSAGEAENEIPKTVDAQVPRSPILVFINSKSGGRLGPQLEAMLVELISPDQVFDLSKVKPADVLRYGLRHLEKEADGGDFVALETRNNLRFVVAGGDGTVGWVLGCIADLGIKDNFKVPPVAVIPLGTGNDLSRSFRWGGSTTSINLKSMKRCLAKAVEAEIATLDSWRVVLTSAPGPSMESVKLPYALYPQKRALTEFSGDGEETANEFPPQQGSFWNYFSIGMDAQVAYGFHNLRDEVPWLASGRVSNQLVYGGYGCAQGWFCTPCATAPIARGIQQIAKVYCQKAVEGDPKWELMHLRHDLRALVILNLQSYAGGRNPWGRPSSSRLEKEGFVEAKSNDGILEIVGFVDGWHTAFVLLDWFTAVRLGQVKAVRLELTGKGHRNAAYMQMDGEPWQQPLGDEGEPPVIVDISCNPTQSLCLSRR